MTTCNCVDCAPGDWEWFGPGPRPAGETCRTTTPPVTYLDARRGRETEGVSQ